MFTRLKLKPLLSVFSLLVLIVGCSDQSTNSNANDENISQMNSLVTTQWLSENLNSSDLVVLDSSVFIKFEDGKMISVSGEDNYQKGHIPTARFADLKGGLSATHESFEFVMPTPEQFAKGLEELGISNSSRVVIYSAENQSWSARLWWMLRWAGLEQVAILDGGLKAWKEEGRPISTETPKYAKAKFNLSLNPKMIADKDDVLAAIENEQVSIVDALSPNHYSGQVSMYPRAGHIANAINSPVSELFQSSSHYRSMDELELQLDGDKNKKVITYCGGGIAGSAVAFSMVRLGYKDVSVYMGSLQEWTSNEDNPMEKTEK